MAGKKWRIGLQQKKIYQKYKGKNEHLGFLTTPELFHFKSRFIHNIQIGQNF
jgi:hypothetical protein